MDNQKLFISPPFGNYIHLPYTKSIKGSYTCEPRDGLFMQIMKTLRYSNKEGGWVNKIGLRNKGIDYGIKKYNHERDILSIAILTFEDIPIFSQKIPKNMNIEINVSCPNLNKTLINSGLSVFVNPEREYCILKLSPLTTLGQIDMYYKAGFRQFHCSNTLPVLNGGMSGPILISYTTELTKKIKNRYSDTEVICGGGIRSMEILKHYKTCGADHYSVSSLCFNPFLFGKFYINYLFN